MTDGQSIAKIILVGRYEWVKKMEKHSCIMMYSNHQLTMNSPPPVDDVRLTRKEKKGFLRWLSKRPGK